MSELRRQSVRDAVVKATDPTLEPQPREAARAELVRLVSSASTYETVYELTLERAVDHSDQLEVIRLALNLFQHVLCIHAPPLEILFRIKTYAEGLKATQTVRQYGVIRVGVDAVLAMIDVKWKLLPTKDRLRWEHLISSASTGQGGLKLRHGDNSSFRSNPNGSFGTSNNTSATSHNEIDNNSTYNGVMLKQQNMFPSSMVGVGFIGAHLRGAERPTRREEVDIRLPSSNRHHHAAIAQHKNLTEFGRVANPPKPNYNVVQFRFYSLQQSSKITSATFAQTLSTLHSVFDYSSNVKEIQQATATFIKVVCDMYASRLKVISLLRECSCVVQSVLMELLSSTYICVRRQAFDVLFNLCIHTNVLDELSSSAITVVHNDLVAICQEMLRILYLKNEEDDSLWLTGLRCLLAISPDPTAVDIRVLKTIAYASRNDFKVQHYVYGLLLKALVGSHGGDEGVPIPEKLEAIGGMSYLLSIYASCTSYGVRERVFSILFKTIIHNEAAKEKTALVLNARFSDTVTVQKIFSALQKGSDLPWYLHTIFMFLPTHSARDLLVYLTSKPDGLGNARHIVYGLVSESIHFAQQSLSMVPEMEAEFRACIRNPAKLIEMQDQIIRMIGSECEEVRTQAEKLLFSCMRYVMDEVSPDVCLVSYEDHATINAVFDGILVGDIIPVKTFFTVLHKIMHDIASHSVNGRLLYLRVTYRLLLYIKAGESQSPGETPFIWERMHKVLNAHLSVFMRLNPKLSETDVCVTMLELVLSSIGYMDAGRSRVSTSNTASYYTLGYDSIVDLFLQGVYKVPTYMLATVRYNVFSYIFQCLTLCVRKVQIIKLSTAIDIHRSIQVARYASLVLVVSHPDVFRSDILPWKNYIADPYPGVAAAAAAVYMQRIKTDERGKYNEWLMAQSGITDISSSTTGAANGSVNTCIATPGGGSVTPNGVNNVTNTSAVSTSTPSSVDNVYLQAIDFITKYKGVVEK